MSALFGIPLIFVLSLCLYRALAKWLERQDAGTCATFVALGSSCCLFLFGFLPLEFLSTLRLFCFLALVGALFLVVARRKATALPSSCFDEVRNWSKDFFGKG